MKLCRYGRDGYEKPGMIDAQGNVRDLSNTVERIDAASADGFADVYLRAPATGDEFLHWLVATGARVEHFERLSTPLEEIFVRVATEQAVEAT